MRLSDKGVSASIALTILVTQVSRAEDSSPVVRDRFETPDSAAKWQVIHGDWAVQHGAYCQRSSSHLCKNGRRCLLLDALWATAR